MTACPTLETERLILRPFTEADLDAYAEMVMSPEVRGSLHLAESFSVADAWRGMAYWLGQWELRGTGHWAVVDRSTELLVGRAGLNRNPTPDWPGLEVGWTLHPRYWGLGYATEAGSRSLAYAFDVLAAEEVVSVILPENERSQAVARRLGFTLAEERVLSFAPDLPHGIWRLPRGAWSAR